MILYFVRHGETYLNKYKKMQGWADSPLTIEGEKVATKTGGKLADIAFESVYTSDLGRTIQTAKLILEKNKFKNSTDIQPMKEFRETFFGSFEADYSDQVYSKVADLKGITLSEVFSKLSLKDISASMKALDPFGDAETDEVFLSRLDQGLDTVVNANDQDAVILIVTHGNVIRHIVQQISPTTNVFQEIINSSITTVEYSNGKYTLLEFNR